MHIRTHSLVHTANNTQLTIHCTLQIVTSNELCYNLMVANIAVYMAYLASQVTSLLMQCRHVQLQYQMRLH